ncbi:MAG: hypothetical protein ACXV7G_12580 [Halobacteriota archaeon]
MQLSPFDSSHRTGVPGTSEVLIPHDAISFFPVLQRGKKYLEAKFDVILNTPTGQELHNYRFWYYDVRSNGTPIDEYRLRMDKQTIDLSSSGGGDLLVITKLPDYHQTQYEVTIVSRMLQDFKDLSKLCRNKAQEKIWGLI